VSTFLHSLHKRAQALSRRIVFPESSDDRTIRAVVHLSEAGWVHPVLIGEPAPVRAAIQRAGGNAKRIEILHLGGETPAAKEALLHALLQRRRKRGMTREEAELELASPLMFAALLTATGRVDGGVAGAVSTTSDVLRAAITAIGTADGMATVSSSFYMVVRPFRGTEEPEVLTFTDAGVLPSPSAEQLADIAQAAAAERTRIVGDDPRVAFLSYSTHGSADGPEVRKMREALRLFRERLPGVPADGELQADAALIQSVAHRKAPGSPIEGHANILVFPDLDAGNIAYKLVQRLAGAEALGPVLQGLRRPFNDLSRGASADDIAHVACITALQAL
jgi:phosphate acetyltransferase